MFCYLHTLYVYTLTYTYIIYLMRAALKLMPHILLCWPTPSEADIDGIAVKLEPSHQYSITSCCHVTDGSRGAVWQNASEMEECMEQRCVTELLLLNVSGDQAVDVTTVRWWMVHFSSGNADSKSLPLVQIVTRAACRLLFITGDNA